MLGCLGLPESSAVVEARAAAFFSFFFADRVAPARVLRRKALERRSRRLLANFKLAHHWPSFGGAAGSNFVSLLARALADVLRARGARPASQPSTRARLPTRGLRWRGPQRPPWRPVCRQHAQEAARAQPNARATAPARATTAMSFLRNIPIVRNFLGGYRRGTRRRRRRRGRRRSPRRARSSASASGARRRGGPFTTRRRSRASGAPRLADRERYLALARAGAAELLCERRRRRPWCSTCRRPRRRRRHQPPRGRGLCSGRLQPALWQTGLLRRAPPQRRYDAYASPRYGGPA